MASKPGYRIEAATVWYRVVDLPGFRCRRCTRAAEFSRVKFRRTKGAASYDITGYCGGHLPESAPAKFQPRGKP